MDITEILANPLVWGLLAWIFSKLFMSRKQEDETREKAAPPREQLPNSLPNPRPNPTPRSANTAENLPKREYKQQLKTVQQAYEELKTKSAEPPEKLQKRERPKLVLNEIKTVQKISGNKLRVDKQKAIQGVIWSEILGQPRSKNPHYTRNKRHS